MTVRGSKSDLMGLLETTLDQNEEFIGPKVWEELESVFNAIDDEAMKLEDELYEMNELNRELEKEIEELKDRIAELEG